MTNAGQLGYRSRHAATPEQQSLGRATHLAVRVSLVLAFLVYVGIKWVLLYGVAWIFALPFVLVAGASAFISYRRRALLDSRAGLESLRGLSWQDFERLVGEAYRTHGYVVEELGGTAPHGGVDLLLHRRGSKVVIQCKRWKSSQVGVSLIREF